MPRRTRQAKWSYPRPATSTARPSRSQRTPRPTPISPIRVTVQIRPSSTSRRPASRRRQGEEEFVVVAAREHEMLAVLAVVRRRQPLRHRQRIEVEPWPDTACGAELAQVAEHTVRHVDGGARPAAQRAAELEPRRGIQVPAYQRIIAFDRAAAAQRLESRCRLARRARNVELVAGSCARAPERLRRLHEPEHLHRHHERPAHRVAADELHAVLVGERVEALREIAEPVLAHLRQDSDSSAQAGSAPIAARSLRLTASAWWPDRAARRADEEVPAFDQRVGRSDQRAARWHLEQCRVVAHAEQHVAPLRSGA